jgi:hypothetical protein
MIDSVGPKRVAEFLLGVPDDALQADVGGWCSTSWSFVADDPNTSANTLASSALMSRPSFTDFLTVVMSSCATTMLSAIPVEHPPAVCCSGFRSAEAAAQA